MRNVDMAAAAGVSDAIALKKGVLVIVPAKALQVDKPGARSRSSVAAQPRPRLTAYSTAGNKQHTAG